jgi:hypothetical protein
MIIKKKRNNLNNKMEKLIKKFILNRKKKIHFFKNSFFQKFKELFHFLKINL